MARKAKTFILSILILSSGLHLFYKAIALSNMVLDPPGANGGVGTMLFFFFEREIDNPNIPATVLSWKQTSIWLFAISVLFFVISKFVPKGKVSKS